MKDPYAYLVSKRKCRVSSLLTSDMLVFVEALLGICEIAVVDCLDNSRVPFLKTNRCTPPPMQCVPRFWHLEQIGWI
jgi:hypothetical protein